MVFRAIQALVHPSSWFGWGSWSILVFVFIFLCCSLLLHYLLQVFCCFFMIWLFSTDCHWGYMNLVDSNCSTPCFNGVNAFLGSIFWFLALVIWFLDVFLHFISSLFSFICWILHLLDENQVLHHTLELWTSSDDCGCVRQRSHYFSSISPIGFMLLSV